MGTLIVLGIGWPVVLLGAYLHHRVEAGRLAGEWLTCSRGR